MSIPDAVKNDLADTWAAADWVAVFTGAAGTTGANEASGGSYARKQTTFGSASSGATTGSQVEISVAADDYEEGGLFSAETSGNFRGSQAFTGGTVTVSGSGGSIKVTPTITLN